MADPTTQQSDRVTVLERLRRLLNVKVGQGILSEEQAANYYHQAFMQTGMQPTILTKNIRPWPLPPFSKAPYKVVWNQADINSVDFPFYNELFDNKGIILPETVWESKIKPQENKISEEQATQLAQSQAQQVHSQAQDFANRNQIQGFPSWQQMNAEALQRTSNLSSQLGDVQGITNFQKQKQQEEQQYNLADAWQQWRMQQVGNLAGNPRNWIELWKMQHQPNPYAPRYPRGFQDPQSRLSELRANVDNLGRTVDWVSANPPQNPNSEYAGLAQSANVQYESARQQLADYESSMAGEGGGGMTLPSYPQPEGKPLPSPESWMQTYVPGLTGNQITRQNFPTPSMQQWANLSSEQRAKLLGYTDWIGLPEEDIFNQMQRMRPRTPSGVGGGSWQTVRQR